MEQLTSAGIARSNEQTLLTYMIIRLVNFLQYLEDLIIKDRYLNYSYYSTFH